MTIEIGTASGNREVSVIEVGTAGGNKPVETVYVGTTNGNKIAWLKDSGTIPEPVENLLTSEEIIGERTPIKIEDDFYVMDTESYAGVRFNWMNLEVGEYKVTLQFQNTDNDGRIVILKDGTGSPITGTNVALAPSLTNATTQTIDFIFNTTSAGQYSLIIVRARSTGTFKVKVDSITVTAV